jgi:two-component system, OmpR family, sensor kinase
VKTGSLRARVTVTTLALLVVVLAGVIAAVTIAYRSSRQGDLAGQLHAAADQFRDTPPGAATKILIGNLARQGIAVDVRPSSLAGPAATPAASDQVAVNPGELSSSLVLLDQVLPDGTHVTLSASNAAIDGDVRQLLTIEILVAIAALLLAALLIRRVTGAALRPLADVSRTAARIAGGKTSERLRPTRPDTELGSMAAAFDDMVGALEAAVRQAKDSEATMARFLADASHELRRPIAAVQATAETLLREQPRRPTRDALEAALAGDAARLGRLVDDLLSLARLDAPAPARSANVDLSVLAEAAIADTNSRALGGDISLDVSGAAAVKGDPDAISRIIRNLLENAVAAAGPAGHVRLRVAKDAREARLSVEDDGPGVPATERERIFDRFVRLVPGTPTGSGLGLSIARRIARQHHGDLTCDGVERGARFILRLPLAGPAEHGELTRPPGAVGRPRTAGPPMRIAEEAERPEDGGPQNGAWPNGKAIDS